MTMEAALKEFGRKCPHCGGAIESRHELWYCHKCEQGGNVYRYIADTKGMSYVKAYMRYGDGEFDDDLKWVAKNPDKATDELRSAIKDVAKRRRN